MTTVYTVQPHVQSLVDNGEFSLTAKDFRIIATIMRSDAGIALQENKASLVYSRLAKRLRALGLKSFSDYCALVVSSTGQDEREAMIAALTTNVTRFFREPHHFEHLQTIMLPRMIANAKQGKRVRLWSAACSSGQEPYSMALVLLSLLPDAVNYDIKILATDIDATMIELAKSGIYPPDAVSAVPLALRNRWFVPIDDGAGSMRVTDELRAIVTFRKLNLIGDWPMHGKFDVVFCRNVVIYFDDDTQSAIWSRIAPLLDTEGVLYIGHSERVAGPAALTLRSDGVTTYRPIKVA